MECIQWSKKQDNKRLIQIYKKWFNLLENNQISVAYKNPEILQLVQDSGTEILFANRAEPNYQRCSSEQIH